MAWCGGSDSRGCVNLLIRAPDVWGYRCALNLMHLGVGRPWFFQSCWNEVLMSLSTRLPLCSKYKAAGLPQRQQGDPSDQRGRRTQKRNFRVFYNLIFRSDMPSLLLHAIGHWDQSWYKVAKDYTPVWITLGGDHCESYWSWFPYPLRPPT